MPFGTFDTVEQNAWVVYYTLESYIIILFIYMEKIYMVRKVSAPIQGWQIHGILVHGSVDKLEDGISLYDGFHSVYIYIYFRYMAPVVIIFLAEILNEGEKSGDNIHDYAENSSEESMWE